MDFVKPCAPDQTEPAEQFHMPRLDVKWTTTNHPDEREVIFPKP
jgi:hypothetical protein